MNTLVDEPEREKRWILESGITAAFLCRPIIKQKYESDDTSFLKAFGKAKVFYSTPYGDHKDGGRRLFALPDSEDTGYLPVFSSLERIKEFYENASRCAYMIM